MTAPKLAAYAVTLVFGAGPIFVNTLVAHSPEEATARLLHQVMREKVPAEDLTGIAAMPLDAEWLRFALRSIETGKAEGQVLSIVQPSAEPDLRDTSEMTFPDYTSGPTTFRATRYNRMPLLEPESSPKMPTDPDDAA
jgi:hypothetical protein